MAKSSWQDISRQVQIHRDETLAQIRPLIPDVSPELPRDVTSIPKEILSPREIDITETSTENLISSLASGNLSSTETNCVTELLPERALARARELDEFLEKNQKPLGPLHGLPISVKECFGMKGLGYNAGFVAWVGKVAEKDAHILEILWNAGCVFYVRTTEPQTLMHLETSSNLYGTTVNPFNRALTSGGSSGGEGALLGIRGSCLGVGSDIGGSIRSPAANNGLYGFRTTGLRIPKSGVLRPNVGGGHITSVAGPLSTSLAGIKIFVKTLLDAKPWMEDPSLIPLPWRDEQSYIQQGMNTKLRVGVLWNDAVVKPHPPVTRALKEVVEKLKHVQGVEVAEWKPYKHDLAGEVIASLFYVDGGEETTEVMESSGEPWHPLSRYILTDNPHVKPRSFAEIQDLTGQRDDYRLKYAQIWNSTAARVADDGSREGMMDVILCPAGPGAAPLLECSRYWGYTTQWNLLDYPALVFPVTKVDSTVDVREEDYVPINAQDQYNYNLYKNPENYHGAPVSLQLVGRRFEDEKVIEAMEYIQEKIGLPFAKYT